MLLDLGPIWIIHDDLKTLTYISKTAFSPNKITFAGFKSWTYLLWGNHSIHYTPLMLGVFFPEELRPLMIHFCHGTHASLPLKAGRSIDHRAGLLRIIAPSWSVDPKANCKPPCQISSLPVGNFAQELSGPPCNMISTSLQISFRKIFLTELQKNVYFKFFLIKPWTLENQKI